MSQKRLEFLSKVCYKQSLFQTINHQQGVGHGKNYQGTDQCL